MKHYARVFGVLLGSLVLLGQACISFGGGKNTAAGPVGVYVSQNRGEDWTQIVSIPTAKGVTQLTTGEVYKFVDDPQDPKALYWASREHGLLYSYDEGRTWEQAATPLHRGFIYSLVVHPAERCTIYATNGRQIFQTLDCARSWKEMFTENRTDYSITSVTINPFAPYQVYAATSAGDIFKSVDSGNSWQTIALFKGKDIRDLQFDRNKEGMLYAASRKNGLYRSVDAGATWDPLPMQFKEYAGALQYRRFFINPGKAEEIYWISKYGILTSRNSGGDWEPLILVTPPGSVDIYGFTVNPKNNKEIFYTGSIQDKSTFYRSSDGGITWETRKLPTRQTPTAIRIHPEHDGWVYLGFTYITK